MRRKCSISIDVDPINCYYRIHSLGPSPDEFRHVIMRKCIPRFISLFEKHNIDATFFIVAQDLDSEHLGESAKAAYAQVQELSTLGHEIGNHSYSHPYELARMSVNAMSEEIARAHELLSECIGKPVVGFRAPGYDISGPMLDQLMHLGYLYDSSIFPAPLYYAAKMTVMAALALAGRPSGAVLTNPRALAAEGNPYRPRSGAPWRKGQSSVVELPIAVTPLTRMPAIGTSLLLAPQWIRNRVLAAMKKRPFFNLELHGIDLCDAEEDGIPGELIARQPDLRIPLEEKHRRLESTILHLAKDYDFCTLEQSAQWVQREVA